MTARIDNIGIYVSDLKETKRFFVKYFGAAAGEMYHNPHKDFRSYMLTMSGGMRLELMLRPGMTDGNALGVCHVSIGVGSRKVVDALTETLHGDGYEVTNDPRTTGDGYYESAVIGVDGNLVEITI